MDLVSIEIEGYKRFLNKQTLNVDCKLISILGPNEAGKTTLLNAAMQLEEKTGIETIGPSQETTKGENFNKHHNILSARYYLGSEDRDALKNIKDSNKVKWLIQHKLVNGKFEFEIVPNVKRNIVNRLKLIESLEREVVKENSNSKSLLVRSEELRNEVNTFLSDLEDRTIETLSASDLSYLNDFALTLGMSDLKKDKDLSDKIVNLVSEERKEPPSQLIIGVLTQKLAKFIYFSSDHRQLSSVYTLSKYYNNDPKKPNEVVPAALNNLANVAEFSLEELFNAIKTNDEGVIESLLVRANQIIRSKLGKAWSQSGVHVHLRNQGNDLHILVGSIDQTFMRLDERSEGLKQYVALFSFLSCSDNIDKKIILLIDEVEQHLHYDAQADLIQVLAEQELVSKVIYTTHSIGCLPEDFGMGVRMVEPDEAGHSKIVNKYWANNSTGFSPILYGMGATTMAFLPIRNCVITEGASDMILLPTLLKLATEREALGFQIVQGLAESSGKQIASLNKEGGAVLFLVDGDKGGKDHIKRLRSAKINENNIMSLQVENKLECVIEDFVDKDVYLKAINKELEARGHELTMDRKSLSKVKRPDSVGKWCKKNGIEPLSKVNIAYHILNQKRLLPLVQQGRKKYLVNLLNQMQKCLKPD